MTSDEVEELLSGLVRSRSPSNLLAAVEGLRAGGGVIVTYSIEEARRIRFEHRRVNGLMVVAARNFGRAPSADSTGAVIVDAACVEKVAEVAILETRRRRHAEAELAREALRRRIAEAQRDRCMVQAARAADERLWRDAWVESWRKIGVAYARDAG